MTRLNAAYGGRVEPPPFSARRDPDILRAYLGVTQVLWRGRDALARPGIAERAVALADVEPLPGPSRDELVALAERGAPRRHHPARAGAAGSRRAPGCER